MTTPADILEKLGPGFNFQALASAVGDGALDNNPEAKKRAMEVIGAKLGGFAPDNTASVQSANKPVQLEDVNAHLEADPWQLKVEKAKRELAADGITAEQKSAYKGRVSDAIFKNVFPFTYQGHGREILPIAGDILTGDAKPGVSIHESPESLPEHVPRYDAWRLFLGMPQKHGTFEVSDYKPTKGENQDVYYFKMRDFWPNFRKFFNMERPENFKDFVTIIKGGSIEGGPVIQRDFYTNVMGQFAFSLGQDKKGHYIAYYDKWDLDVPMANKIGRPFEVYDRLYYDPKTYKLLDPPTKDKK